MFARLNLSDDSPAEPVAIDFEGRTLSGRAGDTVAATLLAEGVGDFRTTPISASPRAPWCMMGACFDCLVEIDGIPNQQACQVIIAPGMRIARQQGARRVES